MKKSTKPKPSSQVTLIYNVIVSGVGCTVPLHLLSSLSIGANFFFYLYRSVMLLFANNSFHNSFISTKCKFQFLFPHKPLAFLLHFQLQIGQFNGQIPTEQSTILAIGILNHFFCFNLFFYTQKGL